MKTTFNKIQEFVDNDIYMDVRISFMEAQNDENKMFLFEVSISRNGYCSVGFDHWPTWEEILEELYIK